MSIIAMGDIESVRRDQGVIKGLRHAIDVLDQMGGRQKDDEDEL